MLLERLSLSFTEAVPSLQLLDIMQQRGNVHQRAYLCLI